MAVGGWSRECVTEEAEMKKSQEQEATVLGQMLGSYRIKKGLREELA